MDEKENWVVFRTYINPVEANIDKGVLETNGIPVVLMNDVFSSVLPVHLSNVGEIRLMIPREMYTVAADLITER